MDKLEEQIIQILKRKGFKYDMERFDSGAIMIDAERDNRFFCIQVSEKGMGISEITDAYSSFSTIPDENFTDAEAFLKRISETFLTVNS